MSQPSRPLADRIRPETLDQFIGQTHLVGVGKPIYQTIKTNRVHSMILWGTPGVGKTTLARIIAHATGRPFFELSAVSASKDDVRTIVERARRERSGGQRDLFNLNQPVESKPTPILFLDEIHRFNKLTTGFSVPMPFPIISRVLRFVPPDYAAGCCFFIISPSCRAARR